VGGRSEEREREREKEREVRKRNRRGRVCADWPSIRVGRRKLQPAAACCNL